MTCVGKKSSEIKDDFVLITMFAGSLNERYIKVVSSQVNAPICFISLLSPFADLCRVFDS